MDNNAAMPPGRMRSGDTRGTDLQQSDGRGPSGKMVEPDPHLYLPPNVFYTQNCDRHDPCSERARFRAISRQAYA